MDRRPGSPEGSEAAAEPFADDLALAALALARRLAAGATLWCLAPRWSWHARHLAVEFVHPVVVGKPAVAAVAVEDADPVAALRVGARGGDAVVVVADGDDPAAGAVLRHARAWGLLALWLGAGGPRPEPGAADHVLWIGGDPVDAVHGGGLVRAYHLLWELTHVCLEHPGALGAASGRGGDAAGDEVCVTCADEGRLAEVVAVLPGNRASVRSAAGLEDVDVTLIDVPSPGGLVLVHAGAAVAVVDGPVP